MSDGSEETAALEMDGQRTVLKEDRKSTVQSDQRDVRPLLVKEELQEWYCSLDQEEPEPGHLKEEQEEDAVTKIPFNIVVVKTEDDENEAESSIGSIHHMKTTADCCGVPDPELQSDQQRSLSSGSDTDDSDQWKQPSNTHSGSNSRRGDEKRLSCSGCGRSFTCKSGLTQHIKFCSGENYLRCSFCGKGFTQKGNLETHVRIHTGDKPFSCSQCGKSFNQREHLKGHMRIHTGEKPFSCQQCGKYFTCSGGLKAHMKVHTGEKPFSCSECGKTFSQKEHLRRHLKIHTVEKPFCCSECDKCFHLEEQLRRHMVIHTGEKLFQCLKCSKGYNQKKNLKKHERVHILESAPATQMA
ncbi:gastrula zinc finger protein XlCGF8.2DB-like [Synchiropus splendidus]|uniref:gastrula zinc finger protein XlCGF8.2DB-like n=1 Tax=Synchiropus splendidus TaxID=270530 RepID=UPI00237D4DC3|nr:gastrula zinc finger protein XlCGF8.2DB-like [Synchiropus splendidus]